jgi:endonuclease YncB( thermonuclease family)
MKIIWIVSLFSAILLTGCTPSSLTQQPMGNKSTVALPTRSAESPATPLNTRVLPITSLTPVPTPTITPIPDEVRAVVVGVFDGKTIGVVMQGDSPRQIYRVRYLGLDTPPMTDPWGEAAYDMNRRVTAMKIVRLVRDQTEIDSDGTLPRYVYEGNNLMNVLLVEQGLARAAITPPDFHFEAEIRAAEAQAQASKLGLWSGVAPTPRAVKSTVITPTMTLSATLVPLTPTLAITKATANITPTITITP